MNKLFDETIFNIFQVEGLTQRMERIQADIQPLFQYYGEAVSKHVADKLGLETAPPVHIAKHIRRSVHPPESTWCAIGGDNRGYKKYPHFQIGINEEYLFITLAFIDNIKEQVAIAQLFQNEIDAFNSLSSDTVIIPDHTQLSYSLLTEVNLSKVFQRLETVKSAEMMIGRVALNEDMALDREEAVKEWMLNTVNELLPFYQKTLGLYQ